MRELTSGEAAAYGIRGVSLRVSTRSDIGLVRSNNEDALVLGDLASGRALASGRIGPAGALFGVCDGMGGAAAGEVASRLTATTVLRQTASAGVALSAPDFAQALQQAVNKANRAVQQNAIAHPEREGMGTTCTVAAVRGGLMLVAQVGDSRAYLWRKGQLQQLTKDQNWANEMLARGRVTPEQAAVMENGKAVVQAVGTNDELEVEITAVELCQGDRVLICSDGLSDMVRDDGIRDVLAKGLSLEASSDELLRAALAAGGRDNVSFVLCEFSGSSLAEPLVANDNKNDDEIRLPVSKGPRRVAVAVLLCALVLAVGVRAWSRKHDASAGPPSAQTVPVPSSLALTPKAKAAPQPDVAEPAKADDTAQPPSAPTPVTPQRSVTRDRTAASWTPSAAQEASPTLNRDQVEVVRQVDTSGDNPF